MSHVVLVFSLEAVCGARFTSNMILHYVTRGGLKCCQVMVLRNPDVLDRDTMSFGQRFQLSVLLK